MLKFLNNKRFRSTTWIFLFWTLIFQITEGSEKRRIYTDKLEFVRDFILENYPVRKDHYIKVETTTRLDQNFWEFLVDISDLDYLSPPEQRSVVTDKDGKTELRKVEPEYGFYFIITSSYKLLQFRASSPKIEERLQKAREGLLKEGEINFENLYALLINLGAIYPVEYGEMFKFQDCIAIRYKNGEAERIRIHLMNQKNLWDFLEEGEPIIKSVDFMVLRFDNQIDLFWSLIVKINRVKYTINIEPFYGSLRKIERREE